MMMMIILLFTTNLLGVWLMCCNTSLPCANSLACHGSAEIPSLTPSSNYFLKGDQIMCICCPWSRFGCLLSPLSVPGPLAPEAPMFCCIPSK